MRPRSVLRLVLCMAGLVLLQGCLVNSAKVEVVDPDAKRMAMEFESPEAMDTFFDQVRRSRNAGKATVASEGFGIPFVIGAKTTRVLSDNAFDNQQFETADLNGDGTLSDVEASRFARSR